MDYIKICKNLFRNHASSGYYYCMEKPKQDYIIRHILEAVNSGAGAHCDNNNPLTKSIIESPILSYMLDMVVVVGEGGGAFLTVIEPLSQNRKDEASMVDWIKTNSPGMLAELWPKIQSAVVSSAST
jgi:hypothetical protein